jgi:hypothetical protein
VKTVPGANGPQPLAITSGPDGNIWFTDPGTDSIGVLKFVTTPTPTPTPTRPPTSVAHRTKTSLSTKPKSATVGHVVVFTATVSDQSHSGGKPIGSVAFFDGGTELKKDLAFVMANGQTITRSKGWYGAFLI